MSCFQFVDDHRELFSIKRLRQRRRRIRRGGYPTRQAALEALRRLRAPRLGDSYGCVLTVGDWLAQWHQALGAPVSAATLHRIRATLRAALNAAIRRGSHQRQPRHPHRVARGTQAARGGVDAEPG